MARRPGPWDKKNPVCLQRVPGIYRFTLGETSRRGEVKPRSDWFEGDRDKETAFRMAHQQFECEALGKEEVSFGQD